MRLYDPRNFRCCKILIRGIKRNELFPRHSFPRSREFFPVSSKGRKTEIEGIIKSAHPQTLRHRIRELFIRCLRIRQTNRYVSFFTCFHPTFNRLKATLGVFSSFVLSTSCYLIQYDLNFYEIIFKRYFRKRF